MELSGRLISDSDNRVLMTPFMPVFFFVCVYLYNRVIEQNTEPTGAETEHMLL